ncbi:hypothetical protein ACFQ0B_49655 [Nonomuraea thailandensis]
MPGARAGVAPGEDDPGRDGGQRREDDDADLEGSPRRAVVVPAVVAAAAPFRAGAVAWLVGWSGAGRAGTAGVAATTPAFTRTVAFALDGSVAVTVTRHSPLGSGSAEW